MKKIMILCLILFGFVSAFCSKHFNEGFIDPDRFRIIGYGNASSKETDNSKMLQKFACEAALRDAQMKAGFKLAEYGLKSVRGTVRETVYKEWVVREFKGVIQGGSVIEEVYTPRSRECAVLYEIREKGLREKVIARSGKGGR